MRKNVETIIEAIITLIAIVVGVMVFSFAAVFLWAIVTSIFN